MSQKPSGVCSAASGVLDDHLFTRLKSLLNDQTPLADNLVQEAALESIAILVRKWVGSSGLDFGFTSLKLPEECLS